MRAVVQRVKSARVEIGGGITGRIGHGVLVLLGVSEKDSEKDCEYLASKIANLRIFSDENDLMNLSIMDINGEALIVSQFTLMGDCRKGRRPSFAKAAVPETAEALYEFFIDCMKEMGVEVQTGKFQEMMDVYLVNEGPVTLLVDSKKDF